MTTNILRQHKPGHLLCGAAISVLGALAVVLLVLQSTASHSTDNRMREVMAALAQERARAMGAAMSQGLTGAWFGSLRNCLLVGGRGFVAPRTRNAVPFTRRTEANPKWGTRQYYVIHVSHDTTHDFVAC
jgi:hypothetical protein